MIFKGPENRVLGLRSVGRGQDYVRVGARDGDRVSKGRERERTKYR